MIIECVECKKEVSDRAKTCPHCGYDLTKKEGNIVVVPTLIVPVWYNLGISAFIGKLFMGLFLFPIGILSFIWKLFMSFFRFLDAVINFVIGFLYELLRWALAAFILAIFCCLIAIFVRL